MASFTSAQSLLAIPEDLTKPDAHQVFGLPSGESDPARIAAAVKATITRLNRVKEAADPVAWRQAAAWVQAARRQLADAATPPGSNRATEPVSDPLAGVLPGLAPATAPATTVPTFRAGSARLTAETGQPPPPPPPPPPQFTASPAGNRPESRQPATEPGIPATSAAAATSPAPLGPIVAAPVVVAARPSGQKRRGRRRNTPWASIAVVTFAVGCIGIVAALIYVLNQNQGKLVVSLQPGGAAGPSAAPPQAAAAPSGAPGRSDPVMGRLGGESTDGRGGRPQRAGGDLADAAAARRTGSALGREMTASGTGMTFGQSETPADDETMPSRDASAAMETSNAPEPDGETMPDGRPEPGPTDEQLAAGEMALMQARESIRSADWPRMIESAERALAAAGSSEQRVAAERLGALAELATHYHQGIERGLGKLSAGESFELTEQLQVVIVEINAERVIVRFSGRNKEYPRESLPLVIVHKVARFALPVESPVTAAAAMAFQAIAPVSTVEYRQQAIRQLAAIEDADGQVDPTELIAAIEDVYAP